MLSNHHNYTYTACTLLIPGCSWISWSWKESHYSPLEHCKVLSQWQLTTRANVTLIVPILRFVKDQTHCNSYPALLFSTCMFSLALCIENSDCKNCVIILFRKKEGISLEANCQLSRYLSYTINAMLCAGQWAHTTSCKTFFMQFHVFCMLCHLTHCLSWTEVHDYPLSL